MGCLKMLLVSGKVEESQDTGKHKDEWANGLLLEARKEPQ